MVTKEQLLRLRKATMLGITKCQNALQQAGGDFEQALDLLRKEGQKIANKRTRMDMAQGRIFIGTTPDHITGVLLSITSETDFVANSQPIQELGNALIQNALANNTRTKETLLQSTHNNQPIQERLTELSGQFKENIAVQHYHILDGDHVGYYLHTGNKLGAMITLQKPENLQNDLAGLANDIALQVVVSDPIAIHNDGIPQDTLNKEKEIILAQLAQQNKPAHIQDRILRQKVEKFVEDNILLTQPCIKDEQHTIRDLLLQHDPALKIGTFVRVQLA